MPPYPRSDRWLRFWPKTPYCPLPTARAQAVSLVKWPRPQIAASSKFYRSWRELTLTAIGVLCPRRPEEHRPYCPFSLSKGAYALRRPIATYSLLHPSLTFSFTLERQHIRQRFASCLIPSRHTISSCHHKLKSFPSPTT
jgi:hypothetical protein